MFFAADDLDWGYGDANMGYDTHVRVTDGTLGGTRDLIFDILGGPGFEQPTVAGGNLYFTRGLSLYVTDGTAAGTRAPTGPETAYPDVTAWDLVAIGNRVFFNNGGNWGDGRELWLADGDQVSLLKVFEPTDSPPPFGLTTDGTRAYMIASAPGAAVPSGPATARPQVRSHCFPPSHCPATPRLIGCRVR